MFDSLSEKFENIHTKKEKIKNKKNKKIKNWLTMQMTKVYYENWNIIHKWIDPWSMNKHSNRGLCQSDSFWALLFV